MHTWGDGFDFERLNKAANLMADLFFELSGGYTMFWKEKYGTIRYEFIYGWLVAPANKELIMKYTPEDEPMVDNTPHLRLALIWAIQKYPDMAAELLADYPEDAWNRPELKRILDQ